MIKSTLAAALLAFGASASAQNLPPAATAPASGAALAELLRSLAGLEPRAAQARLKALASSGNDAARELTLALAHRESRPALELRLALFDADGALTAGFRVLAVRLEAADRADAALAILDDKNGPLPDKPGDDDKDGWEHRTEVFAGATGAPGLRLPATGLSHESEYDKGPWKVELGARGLLAPTGYAAPSDGTLDATGSRRLGSSVFRLFAGAELHRDDLMGLARHFSAHAGAEAELVKTKLQTLTLGFGAGAATEKHLDGEGEVHPLTLTSLEYAFKLSARTAFEQEFELESNPRSGKDYEFNSVTAVVYDLSKNLSLRLAHAFTKRGDPVPGYASLRDETTVGLVIHE